MQKNLEKDLNDRFGDLSSRLFDILNQRPLQVMGEYSQTADGEEQP